MHAQPHYRAHVIAAAATATVAIGGLSGYTGAARAPAAIPPTVLASSTIPTTPATTGAAGSSSGPGKRAPMNLVNSVVVYSDTFLGGDAERTWAFITPRCRRIVDKAKFSAKVQAMAAKYGRQPIREYFDSIGADPTKAEVGYHYDNPALDQTGQKWVKLQGLWHNDTC